MPLAMLPPTIAALLWPSAGYVARDGVEPPAIVLEDNPNGGTRLSVVERALLAEENGGMVEGGLFVGLVAMGVNRREDVKTYAVTFVPSAVIGPTQGAASASRKLDPSSSLRRP